MLIMGVVRYCRFIFSHLDVASFVKCVGSQSWVIEIDLDLFFDGHRRNERHLLRVHALVTHW